MDASLILTIILSILSVIASIGITKYYSLRKTITIFSDYEYRLFHSSGVKLPKLEIKYNNEIIKNNIILVRYIICNTGNSDIKMNADAPLILTLPNEFIWKKIDSSSPFKDILIANIFLDRKAQIICTGLLRRKEHIEIESIIECSSIAIIKNNITKLNLLNTTVTKLRIKNLQKIKKKELHEFSEIDDDFQNVKTSASYAASMLFFLILGCFNIMWILNAPMIIGFLFVGLLLNTPIYIYIFMKKLIRHIQNRKTLSEGMEDQKGVSCNEK